MRSHDDHQHLDSTLDVSEIFYSIQGEGARAGHPSIFVRLQGCKTKHACRASGVVCDTEFESGRNMSIAELLDLVSAAGGDCRWIVWTGGEPMDQLTLAHVEFFRSIGYRQAVETSGLHAVPEGMFDHVCVSPKVAEHILDKTFTVWSNGYHCDELRYVRHAGQDIPRPVLSAPRMYLSPHFDGFNMNDANVRHCVELCKKNPSWNLSLQLHKILNVL